ERGKLPDRSQKLFQQRAGRQGADTFLRAGPLSTRDPIVRNEILGLLEACAATAVDPDWRHAEYLLQCISQVQANAVLPAAVLGKIAQARQDESIQHCLDEGSEVQARGDLERALSVVDAGLAQYPADTRLSQMQQTLQEARREKEERARLESEQKKKEAYLTEIQ